MLSSIFLAGLLTASTFAFPFEIPAALQARGDQKYCDADVMNADPPNEYCYQFCDFKTVRRVSDKRKSSPTIIFVLSKIRMLEADIICVPQLSRYLRGATAPAVPQEDAQLQS
jgi:hypothetical protein